MKSSKLSKKIAKTIDAHTQDTGFGFNTDMVGLYFMNIQDNLASLQKYAQKGNLSWKELRAVAVSSKIIADMSKNLTSPLTKDSHKAKYLPILDATLKETEKLYQTVLSNNSINSTIEIGIANKILEEMQKIQEQESKDYNYLYNTVTSGKKNFTANHIEGDEFTLVNHMEDARKLTLASHTLSTSSKFAQELKAIQAKTEKFFNDFSKAVIDHYDTLQNLDTTLNKNDHLIKKVNVDDLKAKNDAQLDVE